MIFWQNHHLKPRHVGGTNDSSNLVKVNIPMHAFLHKCLYEECGRWQDFVAWKAIEGSIPYAEATKIAGRLANVGKKASKETRLKQSLARKGKKHSEKSKQKMSLAQKGKPKSEKAKMNMRGLRPHVNQTGDKNNAFKGWYITPWGKFDSVITAFENSPHKQITIDHISRYCKYINTKKIEKITSSKFLKKEWIGKTFNDLGFDFEKVG